MDRWIHGLARARRREPEKEDDMMEGTVEALICLLKLKKKKSLI